MTEEKDKKEKRGKSVIGTVISIVLWIIVILIFAMGVIGFVNFDRVQNGKDLILLVDEQNYVEGNIEVEVHNFGVYKIVKTVDQEGYTYSLKLWFMDDISKK